VDFHPAAVKFSFAENAKTLVVQRTPVSKSIFGTQDLELIVEFEMSDHTAKGSLLIAWKRTIGALDDCVIGENPRSYVTTSWRLIVPRRLDRVAPKEHDDTAS
jgi:hypothetical protein